MILGTVCVRGVAVWLMFPDRCAVQAIDFQKSRVALHFKYNSSTDSGDQSFLLGLWSWFTFVNKSCANNKFAVISNGHLAVRKCADAEYLSFIVQYSLFMAK